MLNYKLRPAFEYQDAPWKFFKFDSVNGNQENGVIQRKAKESLKNFAKYVIFYISCFNSLRSITIYE